jgi:hypothetical protein
LIDLVKPAQVKKKVDSCPAKKNLISLSHPHPCMLLQHGRGLTS